MFFYCPNSRIVQLIFPITFNIFNVLFCIVLFFIGESLSDSRIYGWDTPGNLTHDWGTMVQAVQDHIRSTNWGYKVQLHQQNVKYFNKYASLVDKNTLRLIDAKGVEETVTARNIVLAAGGRPLYPDVPGAKECCITR